MFLYCRQMLRLLQLLSFVKLLEVSGLHLSLLFLVLKSHLFVELEVRQYVFC